MALATQEREAERSDLLAMLGKQRHFLRYTTRELTDEQARARATVSELTLGGLIKHVTLVERNWARFIVECPLVPGRRALVRATCADARHRGDSAARRACRHHPRVDRRREVDGLTGLA